MTEPNEDILKRDQRMIDLVTKENKTRKQVAAELGVSYALVKNVLLRHRRRIWSVEVDKVEEMGT